MPQETTRPRYIGGSFAPPIDEAKLAAYKALAETAPPRAKAAMLDLIAMVWAWWQLPDSGGAGSPHPATSRATIVPLDPAHIQSLDALVPWADELNLLSNAEGTGVFDSLQGELRNAAFHLLWFGHELTMDREPLTNDKLA